MSKKHKEHINSQAGQGSLIMTHEAEYRIIKHDLIRVLALNVIYFVLIIGLYVANQKTQFLETLFSKLLNF